MAIAEREVLSPRVCPPVITEEEYLAREEAAEEKSEFVQGETHAMAGGTGDHNTISQNVAAALWVVLRGQGCRVMTSDMKVHAGQEIFYYPDVTVVCEKPLYYDPANTILTNPILLAEVLSPSTGAKDRGDKFLHYQQMKTLMSYLLVSQNEPRIEQFSRNEDGSWDYTMASGLKSVVAIPALSVTLALADIYDQIDFSHGEVEVSDGI